jgi:hypothetical protein
MLRTFLKPVYLQLRSCVHFSSYFSATEGVFSTTIDPYDIFMLFSKRSREFKEYYSLQIKSGRVNLLRALWNARFNGCLNDWHVHPLGTNDLLCLYRSKDSRRWFVFCKAIKSRLYLLKRTFCCSVDLRTNFKWTILFNVLKLLTRFYCVVNDWPVVTQLSSNLALLLIVYNTLLAIS